MTAARIALLLSPHLDDVVFSCGGTAAVLADAGWHTILATVFTRSVVPAQGFALACQLDKGLPPEADYMALRRQEDLDAAAILGVAAVHWMDLPEAPHRGYGSAPALFGAVLPGDDIGDAVTQGLRQLDTAHQPKLVLAPQGLGRHVDHQVVVRAALAVFGQDRLAFYRDTPYAIRQPAALPYDGVPDGPPAIVPVAAVLDRKIAACAAYLTQVGFQFGDALAETLRDFAVREGSGAAGERLACGGEKARQAVLS